MKTISSITVILSLLLLMCGCSKDDDKSLDGRTTSDEIYYANQFARSVLSDIYLWNKEIGNDLKKLDPKTNEDPIRTVSEIRYKTIIPIDKWTMLTDDVESLTSSMEGIRTTYGYSVGRGKFSNTGTYFFVVFYVYEGSPAQKAGMRRGDIIMQINDRDITDANYTDVLYSSSVKLGMGAISDKGVALTGTKIELKAVTMYENPILETNVFDCAGKKVGYLAYSGFDLESAHKLVEICRNFKAQGVSELILDLRYNGGGLVFTELVLASMLAPESAVRNKELYETEIWNDYYMDYFRAKGENLNTYFSDKLQIKEESGKITTISTEGANIGLNKIYALIGSGTASASESVLIGLMPYMDIELIGTNSHGKYCTGAVLKASNVYESVPTAIKNWGIYVMINRYADKNGDNPCMPNGLVPDIELDDNPMEGYQLGDEQETMLRAALIRAGKTDLRTVRSRSVSIPEYELSFLSTDPMYGKRIDNRLLDKLPMQEW